MKDIDEKLKKLFEKTDIPEPSQQAKAQAQLSAASEFKKLQKNSKGFAEDNRSTHTTNTNGRLFMKKKHIYGGALATCALVVISSNLYYDGMAVNETGAISQLRDKSAAHRVRSLSDADDPLSSPLEAITSGFDIFGSNKSQVGKPATVEGKKEYYEMEVASQPMPSPIMASPALAKDDMATSYYQEKGRDKFEDIKTNSIKLVGEEPVSTFSIDVDTASYSFMRRQLNNGVLPQKDSIRVEELINYFDYDYKVPASKSTPFASNVAVYESPWNAEKKLVHIGIKGYEITEKPRSNLVFLLDVSGSMNSPDKLPLLVNSFKMMVDNLDEDDTVGIVVYAGAQRIALEPTKISEKSKIFAALDSLNARGSTAGAAGIKTAYELVEQNFDENAVNRVILATDGDFNVGITSTDELQDFVERKREKGVFLSVLGFGQGNYNDHVMQTLAQNGNGNASYIDSLSEARKVLVEEASSTLFPIAKDVKIQVEFNPNTVSEYRLIGYETRMLKREDFNNDKVDAGDIGSGHTVTAIYEIATTDSKAKMIDDLRYGEDKKAVEGHGDEYANLKIRYKLPDESKSKLITAPIEKDDADPTTEMKFAAAVAAYGQLLRGGEFTGEFDYDDVITLAKQGRGEDDFGYRAEFINLVRLAKNAKAM